MHLELKEVSSPDLDDTKLPENPACCMVNISASIGTTDSQGADIFTFVVATPQYLAQHSECRWGRGLLLMPEFSWLETERMLKRLISGVTANTWNEAAIKINVFLLWEFENYQQQVAL